MTDKFNDFYGEFTENKSQYSPEQIRRINLLHNTIHKKDENLIDELIDTINQNMTEKSEKWITYYNLNKKEMPTLDQIREYYDNIQARKIENAFFKDLITNKWTSFCRKMRLDTLKERTKGYIIRHIITRPNDLPKSFPPCQYLTMALISRKGFPDIINIMSHKDIGVYEAFSKDKAYSITSEKDKLVFLVNEKKVYYTEIDFSDSKIIEKSKPIEFFQEKYK